MRLLATLLILGFVSYSCVSARLQSSEESHADSDPESISLSEESVESADIRRKRETSISNKLSIDEEPGEDLPEGVEEPKVVVDDKPAVDGAGVDDKPTVDEILNGELVEEFGEPDVVGENDADILIHQFSNFFRSLLSN